MGRRASEINKDVVSKKKLLSPIFIILIFLNLFLIIKKIKFNI